MMSEIPPSQYQSFEPGKGSSDSAGKLAALNLPDLTGKRFLDLGCNHGYFCFAALDRGAAEVVGIDRDPTSIRAATARAQATGVTARSRFINTTWDDFSEHGFDVIILLSALHYAKDQLALLDKIASMLNPDGMLILEGGVIPNRAEHWTSVTRGRPPHTDTVKYPDPTFFFEALSKNFAPRDVGPSVIQPGDNIPRMVWHCRKLSRMVNVVNAPSGAGKTTFAFSLRRQGIPVVDVDQVIVEEYTRNTIIGQALEGIFKIGQLQKCFMRLDEAGLLPDLANAALSRVNDIADAPTVTVMSALFENPNFRTTFMDTAARQGFVIWESRRIA